jgi:hypothetical protein
LYACTGLLSNHDSPLRPLRFVTRKIVHAVAAIAAGRETRLSLGNIEIERDWGWAPEYIEAMARMLEAPNPEDYIIATGHSHKLIEFVEAAFELIGKNWREYVTSNELLIRPTDILKNKVDPSKSARGLGWKAKNGMRDVVRMMLGIEFLSPLSLQVISFESCDPEMSFSPAHPLLIQVVPRLTPGRCGVSDQAMILAHQLKSEFGIDSAFAVLNSEERCSLPYATIHCPAKKLLDSCLELTSRRGGSILVHLSGSGYSLDGAPTLLADAIEAVMATGQFRMATYFHEIFASGAPWSSAFWHAHRQRKALSRILAKSELVVTSIEHNASWLRRESNRLDSAPVELMPIYSPAGETDEPVPFDQRDSILIIFGLAGSRNKAYRQLREVRGLVKALDVQEILDIGPECNHPIEVHGVQVKRLGMLDAADLPAIFSRARFGFVTHEWSYLGRSSVLAGYCAQGVVPVHAGPFARAVDGLAEGVHVVTPRTVDTVRRSGWEACSRAAWNWYMPHRARVHAERYAKWMGMHQ